MMPDSTPLATRLAEVVYDKANYMDYGGAARALDDAGVRVFIEAVEVVVNATWPPSESDVVNLEQALAVLTGTQEVSDGK